MKKKFIAIFFCTFVLLSCVHESANKPEAPQPIRRMACPVENMLSSGITRAKPTSSEELVRQMISPPGLTAGQEWNINSFSTNSQSLYLSCFYSTRKILTYKLPLEKELCMAKDNQKNINIECVKK